MDWSLHNEDFNSLISHISIFSDELQVLVVAAHDDGLILPIHDVGIDIRHNGDQEVQVENDLDQQQHNKEKPDKENHELWPLLIILIVLSNPVVVTRRL